MGLGGQRMKMEEDMSFLETSKAKVWGRKVEILTARASLHTAPNFSTLLVSQRNRAIK